MDLARHTVAGDAAGEIARHILLATALAEKTATAAPERRGEVDELIVRLEDAIAVAYRLVPAVARRELQLTT
jgi:hypothetical protein